MKREIARKSKRWLKALKSNGFREPYQIIVDNSFILIANKHKVTQAVFNEFFRCEPKFFMTKCTYELHKKHLVDRDFSGVCEIIKCSHEMPSKTCACEFIKEENPHHYIFATNNLHFINKLKESKHIPILKIFKSVVMIECNKLDFKKPIYTGEKASKGEIKRLRAMFGE